MKKIIITLLIFFFSFISAVKAQQGYTAEAVRSGGNQQLKVTDASGKVTTINGSTNAEIQSRYAKLLQEQPTTSPTTAKPEQQLFVSHQAVLLKNGSQEIRWTDAAGKERVVTASKGESIQEKYWAYLQKEGIPCGCTPPVNATLNTQNATKIATK